MSSLVEILNPIFSAGAVVMFVGAILVFGIFFLKKPDQFSVFLQKYGLKLAFLVSLAAVLGSIFYSEIAVFAPCNLCWYQRVFMFPLPLVLSLALLRKEKFIAPYALLLAVTGSLIALYHNFIQYGGSPLIPCSAISDATAACTQRFVFEFGFVTIPFMSLSVFILVISLLIFVLKKE